MAHTPHERWRGCYPRYVSLKPHITSTITDNSADRVIAEREPLPDPSVSPSSSFSTSSNAFCSAWEVYANPASAHANAKLGDCNVDITTGTPAEYKSTFSRRSREINVHFVGVWDTVAAPGATNLPNLPFAVVGEVKYFRQALALDERRGKFAPEYWHREVKPEREGRWIRSVGETGTWRGTRDALIRFSSGKGSDSSSSEERTIELESSSFLRKTEGGVCSL